MIYGNVELHAVFVHDDAIDDPEIGKPIDKPMPLSEDKIWSAENTLYVRTNTFGSIIKIYRINGMLYKQYIILTEGMTFIELPKGIYIVTINNGTGQKIIIN
jgi:hypothetical protein